MEALLTSFIAAALAEIGDKTQLLVIAFAAAYRRPASLIAGLIVAAVASGLLAAAAGTIIHDTITLRAISLLVALALVYSGVMGLFKTGAPACPTPGRTPAFLAAAICLLAAEMGEKSQFLTAAIAAQFNSFLLAGLGGAAGIIAVNIPAAVLGAEFGTRLPLRGIRIAIAALFLVSGAIVAVNALRLV